MRKIFYKLFVIFCIAAYLPLLCIYIFNYYYVEKYIERDKKSTLINVARSIDINEIKKIGKLDYKNKNGKVEVYIRYIDLNDVKTYGDFFKLFKDENIRSEIINIKNGDFEIRTLRLSTITNHFFLIKKISNSEILVVIDEIMRPSAIQVIMLGLYRQYSIIIIPILLIGAYAISKKLAQPIELLEKISSQISNSNFTEIVEIKSNNELARLGENINKMARKLRLNIEELNILNAKLREELEVKERILDTEKSFMRAIGHELKTPVAIINGYIEALQDDIIQGEEVKKTYSIIYHEGLAINKLIKDINEYLKLEFKNLEPNYEKLELKSFLTKNMSKYRLDIEQKNIDLKFECEELKIFTDSKYLGIVLNNLITNAITYVDERKKIEIILKDRSLEVKNTSSFLSTEMLQQLFAPFYKGDSSRNRKYGGTGLGLSIVKNLLEVLKLEYSFTYDETDGFAVFSIKFS